MQIMLSVSAAVYALTMDPYAQLSVCVCVTPTTSIYTQLVKCGLSNHKCGIGLKPILWYRQIQGGGALPDAARGVIV